MPSWQLAIQVGGSYGSILKAARWAEESGLAAIALPDHYLALEQSEPAWDHLIHFGGLARETTSIELVDLVSPITFRHPAVYAKTAVTLADMTGGRFVLGLGTGWMEDEHRLYGIEFPSQKERFDRLEECLAFLHALKNHQGFTGTFYRLEEFSSPPDFEVPIVVGGTGPARTPELAGRYCDELNIFPSPADDVAQRIEVCRAAAIAADRDPKDIRYSFTFEAIGGLDRAGYRNALEKVAKDRGRSPEQIEERLRTRGIPHGFGPGLREQMEALAALGISRFYLQCFRDESLDVADLVAPFMFED
jgi:alkanesulfonate monooxygenase SsuD/methylene tetrahydromethanopterin reductase-like flavin-dependent oxidoreductase (luciferase family)